MEGETDWLMRRRQQRGFALLFIFALAGIIAILLYNELPRAVFESQRAKEDLLVSRGQEYQRGIQLYYRKFRKYPATMEELEKSSGVRFLRRRYPDPFTGKDDWRLVHVGPTGQFTDSKVIKPPQPAQGSSLSTSTTDPNQFQQQDPNDPAFRRRASDVSASEIGSAPGLAGGSPADPNQQNLGAPPPPGGTVNNPGFPGRTMPGVPANSPYPSYSVGGVGSVGSYPTAPPQSISSGLPNTSLPSASISSQQGGMQSTPIPNLNPGGYPQNTQPGQRPLTAEQISPALNVIQNLLTRPRTPPPGIGQEGGMGANPLGPITNPGGTFLASGPAAGAGNGQFGGGGIAGVASKKEGKGIKIINERERIEEWEFIYDWGKDRGGRPGSNAQGQNQMPGGMNPAQGMGMGMGMGTGSPQQGRGFGQQQPGSGRGGGGQQRPSGGFNQQPGFGQQPMGRPRN
jgi:type II secretory pathway pseudopilin PulG